ncbi:NAD(P)/FAD-dependent oxidoreductase [Candidatus Woesearchaeota archaeon]|nr:NAD(P)/FAD-dependent oxidoreductase [Candidatus Woesearchaeota archaeon]
MLSIVGAGPAGGYLAWKMAERGFEVELYEEHGEIGRPVACTGILTPSLWRHIPKDDGLPFVLNTVSEARIYAPSGEHVPVRFKEPDVVVDRELFDRWLVRKAEDAGCDVYRDHRFEGYGEHSLDFRNMGRQVRVSRPRFLVGADGPGSTVAKASGLGETADFWIGAQARFRLHNDNAVRFYPFVGSFAWVVPESRHMARVGLLVPRETRNVHQIFWQFASDIVGDMEGSFVENQPGIVPRHAPGRRIAADLHGMEVFLLGDAAGQVKATTGGGIVPAFAAADALASHLAYKRLNRPTDLRARMSRLNRELWLHARLRTAMDRFKPADWDKLVRACAHPRARAALASVDRDRLLSLLPRLVLRQPRLLTFIRFLARS